MRSTYEFNPYEKVIRDIQRETNQALKIAKLMDDPTFMDWQADLLREILRRYSSEVSTLLDTIDTLVKGERESLAR